MKKTDKDIQMLGPQVALEGSLVFEGTLYMNGHAKGTIESGTGTIIVGESAVLHAEVSVQNAIVSGEIKGTVRAAELIKLHPSARVKGELHAPRIQIDPGAVIDGRCTTRPVSAAEIKPAPERSIGAAGETEKQQIKN